MAPESARYWGRVSAAHRKPRLCAEESGVFWDLAAHRYLGGT